MRPLILAAVSFGLLLAVFWPLERLFPSRRDQAWLRPAFGTDLLFFLGQYLVWASAALFVLTWLDAGVATLLPPGVREASATLPAWGQGLVALLLGDLCVYWFHRACHRFEWLWRIHAVHHSSEHLDGWRPTAAPARRAHPAVDQPPRSPASISLVAGLTPSGDVGIHPLQRPAAAGPARVPRLTNCHWHHLTECTAHNCNLAPWTDPPATTTTGAGDLGLGLGAVPEGLLLMLAEPFRPVGSAPAA